MPPLTRPIRRVLAAAAILASVVAFAPTTSAHSGIQSYVYVSIGDSSVDGRVEFPADDLAAVLGVDLSGPVAAVESAVETNTDEIREYTAEHLAMSDSTGEPWELSFTEEPSVLPVAGNYVVVPFTVERSFGSAPRSFLVEYDGIIHANPERDALFLIENDWGTAQFDNENEHLLGFSVGMTERSIELDDVGAVESMTTVRGLGTDAIRVGIDQLLFVVALILPAAFVVAGGDVRGRAPTLAGATRRAAASVGVYVVANSAALWALGLWGTDWSGDVVGSLVAASLLVMAASSAWRTSSHELALAAVLGVVQGVGFAQAFSDAQLDRIDTPLALLAFNVGVEVGALIIAALVFPLFLILRRTTLAAITLYGVSTMICVYAVSWLFERLAGTDLNVERFANPFRVWPRNLWLMLLAWVLAGALYAWTAKRDALRPIENGERARSEQRPLVTS